MAEPTDLVIAKKVLEQTEAIRLQSFLEGEGVHCTIVSYRDGMFEGISQDPTDEHWGEIRVLERDLERARRIIADIESSTVDDEG